MSVLLRAHLHSLCLLPLHEVNGSGYLQEAQRGRRHLEDPLHHGDPQDQQDQGYQQVRVHPKEGKTLRHWSANNETTRTSSSMNFLQNCNHVPHLVWYHRFGFGFLFFWPRSATLAITIFTYLCLSEIETPVLS